MEQGIVEETFSKKEVSDPSFFVFLQNKVINGLSTLRELPKRGSHNGNDNNNKHLFGTNKDGEF